MFGLVNKAVLARGAPLARQVLTRRMSHTPSEQPAINGNVALAAGVGLAIACGSYGWMAGYEPLVYFRKPKKSSLKQM